ncbi:hypothetical protein [Corynebacterium afermentans]|nr:hypothetical protein [Corynebacterium afermentans]
MPADDQALAAAVHSYAVRSLNDATKGRIRDLIRRAAGDAAGE